MMMFMPTHVAYGAHHGTDVLPRRRYGDPAAGTAPHHWETVLYAPAGIRDPIRPWTEISV
jgi:hypothetical protein